MRFSRKYHDSVPSGFLLVGKDAFNCVRRIGLSGDSLSRPRSSIPVSEGMGMEEGARKMVFSTLASASQRDDRKSKRKKIDMV